MGLKNVSDKSLNSSLNEIAKTFGEGFKNFGLEYSDSQAISTGHDDLDDLLTKGSKGIFLGGIIEVLGSEGSGKSSLVLRTVGNAQKEGYRCCWIDTERSFEPNLAILNGCDPSQLLLPDLTSVVSANDSVSFLNSSQVLEMVYKTVMSNMFGLVVVDSVAGLMPQRVLNEDFDPNSSGMSELARSMSTMLPKITHACSETKTSVILINQLRDQPGAYMQNRFHTPGGRAMKFFAHQRISVEKMNGVANRVEIDDPITQEKIVIGHYAKVTIVKNRKAPPVIDSPIEIPIYYREYFPDDAKKAYDLARKLQVVSIRNSVLTWKENDNVLLQVEGESQFLNQIREQKLEPKLAYACVLAAADEKNQQKKSPITVPSSLVEISKTYQNSLSKSIDSDSKQDVKVSSSKKKKSEQSTALD